MLCCVMLALELSTQSEVTTGSQVMVAIMYGTLTREFIAQKHRHHEYYS